MHNLKACCMEMQRCPSHSILPAPVCILSRHHNAFLIYVLGLAKTDEPENPLSGYILKGLFQRFS